MSNHEAQSTAIACLLFALCGAPLAQQQGPLKYGMNDFEIAMLPDYCRARLIGDQAVKNSWVQRMGNDKFIHLHHYCSGLNAFKRSGTAINSRDRSRFLELALKEFNYVLRAWPADFYLAKEAERMRKQVVSMGGP